MTDTLKLENYTLTTNKGTLTITNNKQEEVESIPSLYTYTDLIKAEDTLDQYLTTEEKIEFVKWYFYLSDDVRSEKKELLEKWKLINFIDNCELLLLFQDKDKKNIISDGLIYNDQS